VPIEVLEDPAELGVWAKDAIRAAAAAGTKLRRKPRRKGGTRRRG
jgi:hypothetical protein